VSEPHDLPSHPAAGRWTPAACAAALVLFYLWTQPVNRTEAEDAYDFAHAVERAHGRALLHSHHLLYLPLMRGVHRLTALVLPAVRALPTMATFGALAAGLSVVLLAGLARREGVGASRAAACAAALAGSYGFWRYAAEAEIYAPALACALGTWRLAAAARGRGGFATATASALGALAVLLHVFSAFAVFGAIPLWLWLRRGWRAAASFTVLAAALVAGAYAAAGMRPTHIVGGPDPLRAEGGARVEAFAKAAVGWGQSLAAGNFLFAEPVVRQALEARFPARMLEEEAHLGRSIPRRRVYAAGATLMMLVAAGLGAVAGVVRGARRRRSGGSVQGLENLRSSASNPWKLAVAAGAWWAAHAVLLIWMEPGNPELWVMALAPTWLSAAAVVEVVQAAARSIWLLAGALTLHNWTGGMGLLKNPAGDLHRAQSAAALRVAREGDELWTANGTVFARSLRYHAPCPVVDLWEQSPTGTAARVLIVGDPRRPPPALVRRFPARAKSIEELARLLAPRLRQLERDEFGGLWWLEPAD